MRVVYLYTQREETEGRGGRREREGVRERGRTGIVILALAEELCECLLAVVGITKVSQTMTKTPVNFESWEDTILHNTNQKSHTANWYIALNCEFPSFRLRKTVFLEAINISGSVDLDRLSG